MRISIAMLKRLAAAGATPEIIIAAVAEQLADHEAREAQEAEQLAEHRRKERERKRRYRMSHGHRRQSRDIAGLARDIADQNQIPSANMDSGTRDIAWTTSAAVPPEREQKESPPIPPKENNISNSESFSENLFGEEDSGNTRARDRKARASIGDWPEDFFEQFWREYPRKVGKLGAKHALEHVRKRHKLPWASLMAAVRAYAATADPEFTKHPQTWLKQGCWDDEPGIRQQDHQNRTAARANGTHADPILAGLDNAARRRFGAEPANQSNDGQMEQTSHAAEIDDADGGPATSNGRPHRLPAVVAGSDPTKQRGVGEKNFRTCR